MKLSSLPPHRSSPGPAPAHRRPQFHRPSRRAWLLLACALLPTYAHAQSFGLLTREHTDLRILYSRNAAQPLDLVMRDEDRGINHPGTNVILLGREQARLTLPAGTPFGDAGKPFWILPQSQNVNLLYLGVSAEGIAPGEFTGPLSIRLTRLQAPAGGYVMVWQATGPGQFNIRINSRDGLGATDAFTPITGSHEHFNWGFSSTGVFCLTFQVTGQRAGESAPIQSREVTFGFHILPLPTPTRFDVWQKQFWPPGYDPRFTGWNADPDLDGLDNAHEYAFVTNPTNRNEHVDQPTLDFTSIDGRRYATLRFRRNRDALDLRYHAEATPDLNPPALWTPLELLADPTPIPGLPADWITYRDLTPVEDASRRFFQLRLELQGSAP